MKNLFFVAQDGNADELFAMIESDHFDDLALTQLKSEYENAEIDDTEFCEQVQGYLKSKIALSIFAVVMVEREDSDNPTLKIVRAENEDDAYNRFASMIGHTGRSLDRGEEEGEIVILIEEVK
jgi:hypothetical protein